MFKSSKLNRILALMLVVALVAAFACVMTGCDKSSTPKKADVKDLSVYGYDSNGNPTSYYKNEYDDNGNLVKNTNYDSQGVLLGSTAYEYNDAGLETKFVVYDSEGNIQSQGKKEYDDQKRLIQYTDIDANGDVLSFIKREYDEKTGNESRVLNYDADGNLVTIEEYEYNADGNISKLTKLDSNGDIKYYIEYKTDDEGNEIATRYDKDGNVLSES